MEFGVVRVRILHNEGCPQLATTIDRVRRIFEERLGAYDLQIVEVRTLKDAIRLRCLGSPTVQVDGLDVDPTAAGRSDFSIGCRLYDGSGSPSEALLKAAVPVATS